MSRPAILPTLVDAPSPNRSSRRGARVRLFVWHATMGSYGGAVSWLRSPRSQASSHIVEREDGRQATQLVPWNEKAWTQAAFNRVAESNELAGSGPRWPLAQLQVAARICAFRLHERGLPPRFAAGGVGVGFCRHKDLGVAGGGHVDPIMSAALWRYCIYLVKHEAARGGFRQTWGR